MSLYTKRSLNSLQRPVAIRGCCRIKNRPHKHKLNYKIMTDISKNTELQQSCITAVNSSVLVDSNLIGVDLYYRSQLTKGYTKFRVKNIVLNTKIISKTVCLSIDLISENGNKYTYEEDFIFSECL